MFAWDQCRKRNQLQRVRGTSVGDRNVLYLDCSGGFKGICTSSYANYPSKLVRQNILNSIYTLIF